MGKTERLAARAAKIQREAARLRVEAQEAAYAERREQNARDVVDIDKLRAERRARMVPDGTPLDGAA